MCYAVPANITKITNDTAVVDYGGVVKEVNVSLIDNPRVGDYVLVHAGFAIEKLDPISAQKALKEIKNFIAESERSLDETLHEKLGGIDGD